MHRPVIVGVLAGGALLTCIGGASLARPTSRVLGTPTRAGARLVTVARRRETVRVQGINPFDGLELSAAQRAQIKALTLTTRASQREILARQTKGKPPSKDDFAELKRLADAHNDAIRALLTAVQAQRFAANLATLDAQYAANAKTDVEKRKAQRAAGQARSATPTEKKP